MCEGLLYCTKDQHTTEGTRTINNKQILHPLLLNTKIYYTEGENISRGLWPREIFATEGVINLVEGAISVLLYTYTESVEKKIMMKKGKK